VSRECHMLTSACWSNLMHCIVLLGKIGVSGVPTPARTCILAFANEVLAVRIWIAVIRGETFTSVRHTLPGVDVLLFMFLFGHLISWWWRISVFGLVFFFARGILKRGSRGGESMMLIAPVRPLS